MGFGSCFFGAKLGNQRLLSFISWSNQAFSLWVYPYFTVVPRVPRVPFWCRSDRTHRPCKRAKHPMAQRYRRSFRSLMRVRFGNDKMIIIDSCHCTRVQLWSWNIFCSLNYLMILVLISWWKKATATVSAILWQNKWILIMRIFLHILPVFKCGFWLCEINHKPLGSVFVSKRNAYLCINFQFSIFFYSFLVSLQEKIPSVFYSLGRWSP